jgi:hypothetical protein
MTDYTWWEQMQIQKYPDVPPNEAIKLGKQAMGERSRGNRGNPNPILKGNSELAKLVRQGKKIK